MKFKYFDHTADIMFEAYGKTLEETFCNAGLAMFNILTDIRKVKAVKLSILDSICKVLDCQPGDILEYREPETR